MAAELEEHIMVPRVFVLIMARAACLIPCTTPMRLIARRAVRSSMLRLVMLPSGPDTPALLNMMSMRPFHVMARSIARSMSFSMVTSQCVYRPPMESASLAPGSSSMSAITTWAPLSANALAVAAPIPLAPPVITATFPNSLV